MHLPQEPQQLLQHQPHQGVAHHTCSCQLLCTKWPQQVLTSLIHTDLEPLLQAEEDQRAEGTKVYEQHGECIQKGHTQSDLLSMTRRIGKETHRPFLRRRGFLCSELNYLLCLRFSPANQLPMVKVPPLICLKSWNIHHPYLLWVRMDPATSAALAIANLARPNPRQLVDPLDLLPKLEPTYSVQCVLRFTIGQ